MQDTAHMMIVEAAVASGRGRRLLSVAAATWLQRVRTRRQLAELDPRQLADIGRGERERRRECAKWFWQA
jgi:uncharacterized protein YjiS (DUF1127 family)